MSSKSSQLAKVLHVERVVDDGVPKVQVQVNVGGDGDDEDAETVDHLSPPGVDALPLPGDEVQLDDVEGEGSSSACSYADPKNEGKALPGEHRSYARDDEGTLVCEIWQKKDGTIAIRTVASGKKVDVNGVLFDQQGNMVVPGDITFMAVDASNPSPTAVKLSTHLHPTAMGPSGPPQPGS